MLRNSNASKFKSSSQIKLLTMENNWKNVDFPKDGWRFVTIEDKGPLKTQSTPVICEMCGTKQIRYVHHLEHTAQGELCVGCECASKLLNEDSEKTKARETFSKRKWRAARSSTEAYTMSVKVASTTYKLKVWNYHGNVWCLGVNGSKHRTYDSLSNAKYGGFDYVMSVARM